MTPKTNEMKLGQTEIAMTNEMKIERNCNAQDRFLKAVNELLTVDGFC